MYQNSVTVIGIKDEARKGADLSYVNQVEGLKDIVSKDLLFTKGCAEDLLKKIRSLESAENHNAAKVHSKAIFNKYSLDRMVKAYELLYI